MNILILGSGGREHAFAWKIKQSPLCEELYIAPGNAGTGSCGVNIPISYNDFGKIKETVIDKNIDLVIVGPEEPLVNGIVDCFRKDNALQGVRIIGPAEFSAQLEGSKAFAKRFMEELHIPTAAYKEFTEANLKEGLAFIDTQTPPIVLKADGLAAGKGVLILDNKEEAKSELKNMLGGKFGTASNTVVIEEFLSGIEFSVFALTDGITYKILPVAKDYKRIGEGDTGLNTGGMGAVSPVPFVDEVLMEKVITRIVEPTIKGIREQELDYCGFVFFGLIRVEGDPYVIEYNCRMGDPETEVVLPRLKNDMVELMIAAADKQLESIKIEIDERAASTLMMVSGGYPQAYEKGKEIVGLEKVENSIVFHAGTKLENGKVLTNGGRVLAVTGFGTGLNEALDVSKSNIKKISFEGSYFRKDIGFDL